MHGSTLLLPLPWHVPLSPSPPSPSIIIVRACMLPNPTPPPFPSLYPAGLDEGDVGAVLEHAGRQGIRLQRRRARRRRRRGRLLPVVQVRSVPPTQCAAVKGPLRLSSAEALIVNNAPCAPHTLHFSPLLVAPSAPDLCCIPESLLLYTLIVVVVLLQRQPG